MTSPTLTLTEKRALVARRLPKLLDEGHWNGKPCWLWRDTWQPVTEREWLAVMHEAEKTLTLNQWLKYLGYCNEITLHLLWREIPNVWRQQSGLLSATADQRLDAFCRTVGQEDKP